MNQIYQRVVSVPADETESRFIRNFFLKVSHSKSDNVISLDRLSLPSGLVTNRPHVTPLLPFHTDVFLSVFQSVWRIASFHCCVAPKDELTPIASPKCKI